MPKEPENDRNIIIVVCDDHADILGHHYDKIQSIMDKSGLSYEIRRFPDGKPAAEYLTGKSHVGNVVLITDNQMKDLNGFPLLMHLKDVGKLPLYCAVCAGMESTEFNERLELSGLNGTNLKYLPKEPRYILFSKFLRDAVAEIAKKLGLSSRPNVLSPADQATKSESEQAPGALRLT